MYSNRSGMLRIALPSFMCLLLFLCCSCVSPLDPDTPRNKTTDPMNPVDTSWGVLSGRVSDSYGNTLTDATVIAMQYRKNGDVPDTAGCARFMSVSPDGEYHMRVPAGTYILYAVHSSATPRWSQWYNRAANMQHATPVPVNKDDSLSITIYVVDQLQWQQLSGKVYCYGDTDFVKSKILVKALDGNLLATVMTDDSGRYSTWLVKGTCCILAAVPEDTTTYFWQYYPSGFDAGSAKQITMSADQANINFHVPMRSWYSNCVVGRVLDSLSDPVPAQVSLIHLSGFSAPDPDIPSTFTSIFDGVGEFSFYKVPVGQYVIYIKPTRSPYAAGYWTKNSYLTTSINQAARITLKEDTQLTSLTIRVN
jgi:hypothetical protein